MDDLEFSAGELLAQGDMTCVQVAAATGRGLQSIFNISTGCKEEIAERRREKLGDLAGVVAQR